MNKKQALSMVLFLVMVVALVCSLTAVALMQPDYAQTDDRFDDFKKFEKNTVDVIFTGTSGIDRYYIPAKGFEDYGITAYPLTSDAQPAWLVKNMLFEAEKRQDPKLVVIDMRPFTTQYNKKIGSIETGVRYLTDGTCLSPKNKVDAIEKSLKKLKTLSPDTDFDRKTFYLPLIKHHGAWESVNEFIDEYAYAELGFYMSPTRTIVTTKGFEDKTAETKTRGELHPVAKESLLELLDYLDTKDYEVLFINTPQGRGEEEMSSNNTVGDILTERGYKYLICEMGDDYDREKDFYNEGHVNYYGALKFTDYFSEYLLENYDLTDRRNDENCEYWNGHMDEIIDTVALWEEQAQEEK